MKIYKFEIEPDNGFYFDDNEIEQKLNQYIKLQHIDENLLINIEVKKVYDYSNDVKKIIVLYVRKG